MLFFYLDNILDTQPWLTRNCLDISHGRTPLWASSTIRCLTTSGSGLPFTKTPPNWLTPPWPVNWENKLFRFIILWASFIIPRYEWKPIFQFIWIVCLDSRKSLLLTNDLLFCIVAKPCQSWELLITKIVSRNPFVFFF